MMKRAFADITDEEHTHGTINQLVRNAEDLLRAARALKESLDHGKRGNQEAASNLRDISRKILPAIEELDCEISRPQKLPKSDGGSLQGNVIPSSVALTPWTTSDIGKALPALPPISDPVLAQAVFTHSGMISKPGEMSYERLEWLGDAYLYLMASSFIYQTFPQLPAGRCAQYRETLVKNSTLAKFTLDYGLNNRTRFPAEFDLHGRIGGNSVTQVKKRKTLGDIFEAYVAGAVLSDPKDGLSCVVAWMKCLWSNELADEITKEVRTTTLQSEKQTLTQQKDSELVENRTSQDVHPKVQLTQAIGAKGVNITYRDEGRPGKEKKSGLPWYTVGVYVDGWGVQNHRLGLGSALSKKEAGAKAAQAALNNKKMIKGFEQQKEAFVAAIEAQQEYTDWPSSAAKKP